MTNPPTKRERESERSLSIVRRIRNEWKRYIESNRKFIEKKMRRRRVIKRKLRVGVRVTVMRRIMGKR